MQSNPDCRKQHIVQANYGLTSFFPTYLFKKMDLHYSLYQSSDARNYKAKCAAITWWGHTIVLCSLKFYRQWLYWHAFVSNGMIYILY